MCIRDRNNVSILDRIAQYGNIFAEWMIDTSPNNYGTISQGDREVWDVRGSAGVTSCNLWLFETGTI